jgi:hypothetical protein
MGNENYFCRANTHYEGRVRSPFVRISGFWWDCSGEVLVFCPTNTQRTVQTSVLPMHMCYITWQERVWEDIIRWNTLTSRMLPSTSVHTPLALCSFNAHMSLLPLTRFLIPMQVRALTRHLPAKWTRPQCDCRRHWHSARIHN